MIFKNIIPPSNNIDIVQFYLGSINILSTLMTQIAVFCTFVVCKTTGKKPT